MTGFLLRFSLSKESKVRISVAGVKSVVTPRHDRIFVRRLAAAAPQPGDVVTPTSMQRAVNEGIVIAVGPGKRNRVTGKVDEIELKIGDHVCFLDHAGYNVEVDGETLLCLVDEEVFGVRG